MFELQLFNAASGYYVPKVRGDEPRELAELGRLVASGNGFRVVSTRRGEKSSYPKLLALKAPKAPRRQRRPSEGSCYDAAALMTRAIAWYDARLRRGETVTVYTWQYGAWDTELAKHMLGLTAQYGREHLMFVKLDPNEPGSAFGPDLKETTP